MGEGEGWSEGSSTFGSEEVTNVTGCRGGCIRAAGRCLAYAYTSISCWAFVHPRENQRAQVAAGQKQQSSSSGIRAPLWLRTKKGLASLAERSSPTDSSPTAATTRCSTALTRPLVIASSRSPPEVSMYGEGEGEA